MKHARFAVPASRLPVATSSSRRTHPAVACAMRSPSINSPHGCPHNELICDYTHPTISRAMSFIRCSHLAVARAMSSPPDTSHHAAFLRDELVFRHPVSRSYPRAPVVFSDNTCSGRPRNCVRSATVTGLVSQTDDFRLATHLSRFSFPNREESRRAPSSSGYPKLELASLLIRFIGCPTNRRGSQRLRIWLPKCKLVPQRSFRVVSHSKSRLKTLSHRLVARTMSNTSGPNHRPVARSMNLPGSLIFQFPGR